MGEADGVRVLLLEDEVMGVSGLSRDLADRGIDVIGHVRTLDEAVAVAASSSPDVVVADIELESGLAFPLLERLGADGPPVLWLSGHGGRYHQVAVETGGAAGFVGKHLGPDDLAHAVRVVASGGTTWHLRDIRDAERAPRHPTKRELDVLRCLARGDTSAEAAGSLGLSKPTIDRHVENMFNRYGVSRRFDLVEYARARGWVPFR